MLDPMVESTVRPSASSTCLSTQQRHSRSVLHRRKSFSNLPPAYRYKQETFDPAMKIFASSLLAAAMTTAIVRAATCDPASVTALLTSDEVTTCASDSGYSPSSLQTPTSAQMNIMCTDTACQAVLSDLTTMFPEECTVGTFALYADLITPLATSCSGSSSSSTTTSAGSNTSASASTAASATSASASAGSASAVASTSSASLDSTEEVTVAPTTNTTSSASSDDDVTVGDSDSGSDLTIETQAPSSESASTTADSAASASSAADDTSSGSSAGVAVTPSAALLGSALVATAALFL